MRGAFFVGEGGSPLESLEEDDTVFLAKPGVAAGVFGLTATGVLLSSVFTGDLIVVRQIFISSGFCL